MVLHPVILSCVMFASSKNASAGQVLPAVWYTLCVSMIHVLMK